MAKVTLTFTDMTDERGHAFVKINLESDPRVSDEKDP